MGTGMERHGYTRRLCERLELLSVLCVAMPARTGPPDRLQNRWPLSHGSYDKDVDSQVRRNGHCSILTAIEPAPPARVLAREQAGGLAR